MQNPGCIFCQIVADTRRCTALAFMDIHPANHGHCLVVLKAHCATIFETPPDTFASVAHLAARVAVAVRDALRPAGMSLVQANGSAANQTVPHLHIHVLPRRPDDGLLLNWARTGEGDPSRIADIATRIRAHLRTG